MLSKKPNFFIKFFDVMVIFLVVFCAGIVIFWDRSEFRIKDLASVSDINFQENKEQYSEKLEEDFSGVGVADIVSTKEDLQDILDDIAEKLDVIQQQVNEILVEKNPEKEEIKEEKEDEEKDKEELDELEKNQIIYSRILISETKISPIDQRFIKLYNPNSVAIELTGWYLQRKTATGLDYISCVSKNDFVSKTILPNSYFLISKGDFYADIFVPDLVLTENNFLILKNPNGEISDSINTDLEVQTATTGGSGNVVETKSCVGQININTADLGQLKELTGIGDTKAQAIICARPFFSVDDLLKVDGIGQATLQKIKDQNCAYVERPVLQTLKSIEIANLPLKNSYFVGENLDIAGLIVIGKYISLSEDGEFPAGTKEIAITEENITGFDSFLPVSEQILTINFEGFTAEYKIKILEIPPDTTPPSIIFYNISNLEISPNGDGVNDETEIDLEFSEKVKATINILNSTKEVIFKNFYKSYGVVNPQPKIWDGKNDVSEIVPDGEYIIDIFIEDMAGNKYEDESKIISVNSSIESL
jgi:competence ComEA-like helix-hairpin-helix protein